MTITGDQIAAFRKERKMSRQKLADEAGLTPAAIANLEGGRKFKAGEEEKLAAVMGVQVDGVSHEEAVSFFGGSTVGNVELTSTPNSWAVKNAEHPPVEFTWDDDEGEEDEPLHVGDVEAIVVTFPSSVAVDEPQADTAEDDGGDQRALLPEGRLFSNSETATFQRCQRKWWLAWNRHLRLKKQRFGGALAIGTWVHAALATYYVPDGVERSNPQESLERILLDVYNSVTLQLQHLGDQGEFIDETLLTNFQRDADLARAMVEGYMQWIAETGADEGLRVIAPEQIVHYEIFPGNFLIGKIDVRAERMVDGAVLFIDHKTVADLTRPVKTIHMNPQMLRYDLIERNQPNAPQVDGALYNMLRKVKRTGTANPPFFQRVEVRHNKFEIDSHELHTRRTVQQIRQTEEALRVGGDHHSLVPPTPGDDCAYMCEFFQVCPMFDDGSRAEDHLSEYYEESFHLSYYVEVLDKEKA